MPATRLIAALAAAGGLAHLVAAGAMSGAMPGAMPGAMSGSVSVAVPQTLPGRLAALLPSGLHGWVFAVMALACLGCAVHLVRCGSRRALMMASGMAAVMVVAHLGYLLAVAPAFDGAAATTTKHHGTTSPVSAQVQANVHAQAGSGATTTGEGHVSAGMLLPLVPELAVLALTGPVLRRSRPGDGPAGIELPVPGIRHPESISPA
ncbi:hypothetical protein KIH74_05570 [Kineosporia sp. J2-2]|uniref:Uncharacterized protein n=1 Tax=Kineosporia corallincola TaxID=2835133 RepID=A0ABS5TBC4_9ACTN|nr:hypothetical protein [Kineosporia corallincola]MBT0768382.1 hypothetical protein [Kineosporia corallincola]